MCSFLVTTKIVTTDELLSANKLQQFRGPDNTSITTINSVTFLHNLLSITGDFKVQPFISDDVVAIYNGEIYNYKELYPSSTSDGDCIIPTYLQYGEKFIEKFDGEFAIVLYDFKNQRIIFGLDTFGCKPLFYSLKDGIHFSSYKSALINLNINQIIQAGGNEYFLYDITKNKLYKEQLTAFDVDNEHKTNFNDWNDAFTSSVLKRGISSKPVMMGVSEGYDSGAICCGMVVNNIEFKMFSINVLPTISNVLSWRHNNVTVPIPAIENTPIYPPDIKNKVLLNPSYVDHIILNRKLYDKCEPYEYEFLNHKTNKVETKICRDTYGFLGAGFILSLAKQEGYRICLTGLAGDVIGNPDINNWIREHKNLNCSIEGWALNNSVYSCECCSGIHGIEMRYPFLDKKLWQETLWLDKNIYIKPKSPQRQYMLNRNFPFVDINSAGQEIHEKVGFDRELPRVIKRIIYNIK